MTDVKLVITKDSNCFYSSSHYGSLYVGFSLLSRQELLSNKGWRLFTFVSVQSSLL